MSENKKSGGGIGVIGLLGVAFMVLKLTDVIDWSWWYVTMPFWLGFAIFIPVVLLGVYIGTLQDKKRRKEHKKNPNSFAERLEKMKEEQREKVRQN